ncbi:MAG: M28 family peptidase [Eubacteriales bacterium]|nr:M28 family peptidase [Eubacteriales bacterium]
MIVRQRSCASLNLVNTQRLSASSNSGKPRSAIFRSLALLLLCAFMILPLSACGEDREDEKLADYGSYGAEIANQIAALGPRPSGSSQEQAAGEMVFNALTALGYHPERQTFTSNGSSVSNIIVKIPGSGFRYRPVNLIDKLYVEPDQGQIYGHIFSRQVILATRLCTEEAQAEPSETPGESEETVPTETDENGEAKPDDFAWARAENRGEVVYEASELEGISDNASGIASLLTLAKLLKNENLGYDVTLAFVAASGNNYEGTRQLLAHFSDEELDNIDCFYELRNIYAGDSLYVHAGWQAIDSDRKYLLRRKIYEMTDVSLETGLLYDNGEDLLLNESIFDVPNPLTQARTLYREFSYNRSDYLVADELGIPCAFVESYDYNGKDFSDQCENRNPSFSSSGGRVSGTSYDNRARLERILDRNQLQRRVNTVAFLCLGALRKGCSDGVAVRIDAE